MTPEQFQTAANVSRETMDRLVAMDAVLLEWRARHNLIARSTIEGRWRRHYFDSAQIAPLLPGRAKTIADLGAGAGFPGLVLAAMLAEKDVHVTLIEATGKKAAFLKAAVDAMKLSNVDVIATRIEQARLPCPPEIITARALARLGNVLGYGYGIQGQSTRYFLHKGQDVEVELTKATKSWHMEVIRHPSQTCEGATILEIGNLTRAHKS